MKKVIFFMMIFMTQYAYSKEVSLICSMVESGNTLAYDMVVTFDTVTKTLKEGKGDEARVFPLGEELEGRYQWQYGYKYKTYDVKDFYTLNRTTLFMSYMRNFGGSLTNKQGQCYIQNPQI